MSGYQFIGTTANDAFGKSVSSAGDVDGDGLDDLIIGAPNAVGGVFYSGEAYLITGADLAAADAADGAVDGVIDVDNINEQSTSYQFLGGPVFNGNAGTSVTSAGDIDGDGLDDLLITASIPSGIASTTHSITYLVSSADLAAADAADGAMDGVISLDNVSAQSSSYQINGVSFLSSYSSIAAAGDVNGDGIADFIIGEASAFTSANGAGGSYLISGADLAAADAADGLVDGVIGLDNVSAQSTSYQFIGDTPGENSGVSVSSAGDVDGDGQDDLLIGANRISSGGTQSGGTYLINSTDLAAADAADGLVDGIIDLGNVSAQSTSYKFVGAAAYDRAGGSVTSAGDVDGDGLADLLIGVTGDDTGGQDAGGAYLITGADLALADAADGMVDGVIDFDNVNQQSTSYQFIGGAAYDSAGVSVASAGDVDGDGLSDLLIGAIAADGGGNGSGEVFLMTAADLAAADAADGMVDGVIDLANVNEQSTSYQFIGTEISDGAGVSVSSAGDVDGDGLDDLLIGAWGADGGGLDSGEGYLITAASLVAADAEDGIIDGIIDLDNLYQPTIPSISYQFIGTEADDWAGYAVSSAGDVDGDGLADLFIGAGKADGGGSISGEAYLITAADLVAADAADGSVDGVIDLDNVNEQSTSYQFIGTEAGDFAGFSVASAGDVDGDGLDDLLIGAYQANGGGLSSGETYLMTGADLEAADAADGVVDGVIDLDNVNEQATSYQIIGQWGGDHSGRAVTSAGDVDGDGLDDLLIGAPSADGVPGFGSAGESFLLTAADMAAADAADGSIDGVIDLGFLSAQSASYQFLGTAPGDQSGFSVASAGDVDGDGLDDLLIGAYAADPAGSHSGETYLLTAVDLVAADAADGVTDGVIELANVSAQSTSYQFVGYQNNAFSGYDLSSAGDVDGDGLDDLIIGAYFSQANGVGLLAAGESFLITGADLAAADLADGLADGVIDLSNVSAQTTSYKFVGALTSDYSGISVASAGDVDGDGLDDLIIGAINADGGGSNAGETYLMTAADLAAADAADGAADGIIDLGNVNEQSTSYQFIGIAAGDNSGYSVSSAGDVDGDGLDDILIGAYLADGGGVDSGESYLITAANLVAADAEDGTIDGVIELGNLYQPSIPSVSYQFNGTEAGDGAGFSVSSAGDIDGDGLDDLIIGAPRADGGGVDSGESYLVSAADLAAADAADGTVDGVIDLDNINEQSASYQFIGTELGDNAGYSVSSAGDVDGDGLDDLIIGAYHADGGGNNAGESYLITGADLAAADAADGVVDGVIDLDNVNEQSTSYQFIGTEAGDSAGFSVSSAGDVDGDGLDDLIIGSFTADGGGANSGESYLISGADLLAADAADGLVDGMIDLDNINEQATSYQFIGTEAGDVAGYSVASAGDIDGDGLDDLIIGAPNADGGGSNSGESYLIMGADLVAADGADGLVDGVIDLDNVNEQTGSYQFIGTQASDFAGLSVASAGDVDGDGADDLIIGALLADGGGSNSGEGYLLTSADLVAADAADGLVDGVIDLDNINEQSASYQFIGTQAGDLTGRSFASAGDVDGDGLADLIIGANRGDGGGTNSGESFLIMGVDLAAADAADGAIDGVIDLDNINEQSASYQIVGAQAEDGFGWSVSSAGDVDGDGLADILIGANNADGGGVNSGASYLLTAANLAAADGADGTVDGVIHIDSVFCFVAGTRVLTPSGEVPIEDLEVGQMVITKDRGPQPLRWIGTSTRQAKGALAPIRFRKGIIGNHRDLLVSPQHRMLVSGWQAELLFGEAELLVSAVSLVNDSTITRVVASEVTYVHLLFDQHEIVFAEGAPSESFHPGEADLSTMAQAAKAEIFRLFPALEMQDEAGYGGSVRAVISPHEASILQF